MNKIIVDLPTKIIFAPGIISDVSELCSQYGNRLIFISNKVLTEKTELTDKIETMLKAHITGVLTYSTIDSTSDSSTADEITTLAKEARVNLVVALGGFTTLNIAKMVGFLMANGGHAADYLSGKRGTKASIPVATIPTIPGTLAEANNEVILKDPDSEKKKLFKSKYLFPKLSIVDPELSLTLPSNFTSS
ncbi:MAG: iron-containing alcohol dehydrogenase, partial [Actinomycetia bacterium]|nr:iron-containing alcohol dehydrogenase [Actinomycetes bacterium]